MTDSGYEIVDYESATPSHWAQRSIDRSGWTWLLFVIPLLGSGVSWLAGGIGLLTDLSFLFFTIVCFGLFCEELLKINTRWGIGGLTLYGGCLVWFCYDYMANWFIAGSSALTLAGVTYSTLAKASFYTIMYAMFMSVGLNFKKPLWPEKLMLKTPEAKSANGQLMIILLAFAFGISPFFVFTAEPFYLAIWHQFLAGRSGTGPKWIVGRTGNLNFSYGGYVAQILQVGQAGGILAVLYAILLAKRGFEKAVSWAIWLLWLLLGIGGGSRGDVIECMLPPLTAFFLKYQSLVVVHFRRISVRAYLGAGFILLLTLAIVQFQITYRNTGYDLASFADIKAHIEGNSMFSESLTGFNLIPDHVDFSYNRFGVQGYLWALPDQLFCCIISPMPRALWTSKPVDPAWSWYNKVVTGYEASGTEGTTVATGGTGTWYIRYGAGGVIEGGILVGWLMAFGERLLRHCTGRLNLFLFVLGWETWLFRAFRAFIYVDLDGLLVGFTVLCVLTIFLNLFSGPNTHSEVFEPAPAF
jgi:hypothetical protein